MQEIHSPFKDQLQGRQLWQSPHRREGCLGGVPPRARDVLHGTPRQY